MSNDLTINTPQALVQCQNVTVIWSGGVAPYYAGYIAAGNIPSSATPSPAVTLKTDSTSRIWQCNVAAGVQITLTVRDSNGAIVYSAPSTVPPDASSGLSKGAIGGIVGGVIGGLLILGLIFGLLWRRRKRRKTEAAGSAYRREKASFDEGGEPKVEPYVGSGEVDLGPREDDHIEAVRDTTTTGGEEVPTDLERQTKQMLGVTSESNQISSNRPARSHVPPDTKSNQASSPTNPTTTTATTTSDPSSPSQISPTSIEGRRSSPVRREQEVEYVRHTDGGMVQVELPPLYSDVPRG